MEKPREDTPTSAYLEHSAFTVAGVAADPEVAGLEAGLGQVHVELKAKVRELEDRKEEVERKLAVFLLKDRFLDALVREFELRLFGLVNKKRSDALYIRYFKDGLREVTEADPRRVEPKLVADIITSLDEDAVKPGIGPLATELKPGFEAALGAVVQTEKVLTAAEDQATYIEDKTIPELEARWTDEYVMLHGALKTKLPRDAGRVESFFYPFKKRERRKRQAADGAAGGEPAATSGSGG
jgi:hypothetical protein